MGRIYWKGGGEVSDLDDRTVYKEVYYYFQQLPPEFSRFGALLNKNYLPLQMVFADSEEDFLEVYQTSKIMDPNTW